MATILCRTRALYLIILLAAKSFTASAAVSNATNANTPSFPTFSERMLIDATVTTVAGLYSRTPYYNGDSILATDAILNEPTEIAFDTEGHLHFIDRFNYRVRKVDKDTGIISTVVGSGQADFNGDGILAINAALRPSGFTFDVFGDMFVSDDRNNRVRKITKSTGIITTVAGNAITVGTYVIDNVLATAASLSSPQSIVSDLLGNLYFVDNYNLYDFYIKKITKSTGIIAKFAGGNFGGYNRSIPWENIPATSVGLTASKLALDNTSGYLYTVDFDKGLVKISINTGNIISATPFVLANTIFLDTLGNIYYSNPLSRTISKMALGSGAVTTVATNVKSKGIYVDTNGIIYVTLYEEGFIYKVVPNNNVATFPTRSPTVLPRPPVETAPPTRPPVETAPPTRPPVETAPPTRPPVETAPPTRPPTTPTSRPTTGARIPVSSTVVAGVVRFFDGIGYNGDGILATTAYLLGPSCVTFDNQGNMHIADTSNGRIRKVDKNTGIISTVAGTGNENGVYRNNILATQANISPSNIIFDAFGDIYFSNPGTNCIHKITTSTGIITTVVGNGLVDYNGENIPGTSASINIPTGLTFDSQGNLYFTSTYNCRIQKLSKSTGLVNTVAGNGKFGGYNYRIGNNVRALDTPIFTRTLAIDSSGDLYFTGEYEDGFIKLTMSTGILTTILTNTQPFYLFIDGFNNIYYSTSYEDRVNRIYESELYKYTASNGVSTLLANNLNASAGFYVDASGYIYMPYLNLHIVRKVTSNDNATPTPQPTQLTAPPTRPPVETVPPTRPPVETAPPTRPPVETAPPTRPPVETAPPTRPPVETAPPTRPPVSVTSPPSQMPTVVPTRPPTNPTLRPHRSKPSRAPFKKPPRN